MTAERAVEWRTVPGYPDYSVSSDGRVASHKRGLVRELSQSGRIANRYPAVHLCNGGVRKIVAVHRLVLLAFVGPLPVGMYSRHLNDNPTDNRLSNLAYGTHSDNMRDQVLNGGHWQTKKTHCPQGHPYSEANTSYERGGVARRCRTCKSTPGGRAAA